MKITAISTAQAPSTTANSIQVMKVCQAMAQAGHAVTLLLPGEQPTPWDELAGLYGLRTPFEVRRLPASPLWKRNDFALRAANEARRSRSSLVYTWSVQAAVLALQGGLRAVFEAHDLPTGRLGPLWTGWLLRWKGRKRIAVITRALHAALEARYGRFEAVLAPNGVETERYTALPGPSASRAALGLPERVTVMCTGHLYAGRGGDLFLELAARFPQAQFVWVGGRPADVEAYRTRAGANVTFTGFKPNAELPGWQAAADVLLMPYGKTIAGSGGGNSAEICSPMKLFDYLAAGRAILSSDLPVIREVLDADCARFAPPENPAGWSGALAPLLADAGLRERLGAEARRRAAGFDWRARQQRILEGFDEPEA